VTKEYRWADSSLVTHHSPLEFSNEMPFVLSKRFAEVGITIRKNRSTLSFSNNPTKKVSSK